MADILVVGGAGYIGSYTCKLLAENGHRPIVLDSLVTGHEAAVKWGPFHKGSLEDEGLLAEIFTRYRVQGVMHFAAFCYVGESVAMPAKYYQNNVAATLNLLTSMVAHQVPNFIFSSSCATYGDPVEIPMNEEHPQQPVNPYGRTKLMVEQILADFHQAYGLSSVCLRYFNAAGADPEGRIGEDHDPETHLIPLILKTALGQRDAVHIFGGDYPTPDGTCIRDYIHIHDLAGAHVLALKRILAGEPGGAYNLGNGSGYSVREVIETAGRITGRRIPVEIKGRRPGDPAVLVSASAKAEKELGWQPVFPHLDEIIATAWEWHHGNPRGYRGK